MDSEKSIGGNLHSEDADVREKAVPCMLEETLSGFHEIGDAIVEIHDWGKEYDFLLKVKLNDPSRETLPTDHSLWRLM